MQGLAPTVATSPWIRAAFLPLHKDHSVALPARGSHSDIQRERRREGGRKIENRMLRKEGGGSVRMSRRATEGSKALRRFSICPYCVQLVLEPRKTEDRTI